jgi:antitoxin component YwqK of YwqJK toxin-antitoxin module
MNKKLTFLLALTFMFLFSGSVFGQEDVKWENYETGELKSEKHYKNGKLDGPVTHWYKSGKTKLSGYYKDGWEDGVWTTQYESGEKKSKTHYKDRKKVGVDIDWYLNGQKIREVNYKNGQLHGLWTEWDENGRKTDVGMLRNGKSHGRSTKWYPNGKKKVEKHFKNDKENGLWTEWDEDGKKTFQKYFVDGNEQSGRIKTAEPPPTIIPQPSPPQPPKSSDAIATGTGFLFGSKDYIVTNYHVVKGTSEVTVKLLNGESINAEVIAKDTQNDVAVLKLTKSPSFQSREMKFGDSSMVRMGDKVFTIGYPSIDIMGFKPKYTEGVISAVTGIKDDPTVFQTTVPIQPGNSGGPLFNEKGEVVGLTTASLSLLAIESMGAVPQSVNYAVKSSFVKNVIGTIPEALLSNRGIVVVPTDSNSRADFLEAISKNVVLILGKVD